MACRRCTFALLMIVSTFLCTLAAPSLYAGEGLRPYETEGTVVAVVPDEGLLLIDHDPIRAPGFFMGQMEMPFSVDEPALIKGLQVGERIRFRVSEQKKSRILEIQKLAK
jgi:Cu/Ag efflux protein CusF